MTSSHNHKSAVAFTEAQSTGLPSYANVFDDSISHVPQRYRGTSADQHDMNVLGKKQVLRVRRILDGQSTC